MADPVRLFRRPRWATSGWRVAPLILVLVVLYTSSPITHDFDGNWQSGTVRAMSALLVIAPVCAVSACWDVGRLCRRLPGSSVRSLSRATAMAAVPSVVVGSASLLVCLVVVGRRVGPGAPDLRIIGASTVALAGLVAFGALLGLVAPRVVAAPAVLVVTYGWLVYPPAMEPLWIRHLTSFNTSCCTADSEVSARSLIGQAAVGTALVSGLVIVTSSRARRLVAFAATTLVVAMGVAGGWALVRDLGVDPVRQRTSQPVCGTTTPRVCVWAEHRGRLPALEALAVRLPTIVGRLGQPVPVLLTERPQDADGRADAVVIGVRGDLTDLEARRSLLSALVPSVVPRCPEGQPWLGSPAMPLVEAFLELRAGFGDEDLEALHAPELIAVVRAEMTKPEAAQARWLATNLASISACGVEPVGVPEWARDDQAAPAG